MSSSASGSVGIRWDRARWWLLAGILLTAFGLRAAAGVVWQGRLADAHTLQFGDSETYWRLGQTIAAGQAYEYEDSKVFRTPGYPLLLAGLFTVGGPDVPVVAARVLGAVLGTAAVLGVWWLAWKLFDHTTALVAAAMAAVYPGAIASSLFVLAEAPFCPLMMLTLALWAACWQATSPRRRTWFAAATGVAAGQATLVRPSWLLFLPFAIAVLFACCRQVGPVRRTGPAAGADDDQTDSEPQVQSGRLDLLKICGVMLLGLVVTMTPWWVRNYLAVGTFVPTSLQVGASLYDGLHAGADGSSDMSFVPQAKAEVIRQRAVGDLPADVPLEVQLDRKLRGDALAWTWNNRRRAMELACVKLLRLWSPAPHDGAFQARWVRVPVMCSFLFVVTFAVIGSNWFVRRSWPHVVCLLPALYFTLLHAVFVGSIRYRQPAMLPLIVLAAGVIVAWARHHQSKGNQRSQPDA